MLEPDTVCCPGCHCVIGRVMVINGIELLIIGGMVLNEAHGSCARCGGGFHWKISNKTIKQLIQLAKESDDL